MTDRFYFRSGQQLPKYRTINDVLVFVKMANSYNIDPHNLLNGTGIDLYDLEDPYRLITTIQEISVGYRLYKLLREPSLGLELGKQLHIFSKGILGLAAIFCNTVREALNLFMSYIELSSSYFNYYLTFKANLGFIHIKELTRIRNLRRFICETELSSFQTIITYLIEELNFFKEIHLAYPRPDYAKKYSEIFQCPVYFNAPEHLIIFDATLLNKPLKFSHPATKKLLEEKCQQLCSCLKERNKVKDLVKHELMLHGPPFPGLDELAKRINMSERTIRRKLKHEGTSYKDIIRNIRQEQALNLIKTTDYSMYKIAELLSYSDTASFYRAFKSWMGTTPATYRGKDKEK